MHGTHGLGVALVGRLAVLVKGVLAPRLGLSFGVGLGGGVGGAVGLGVAVYVKSQENINNYYLM